MNILDYKRAIALINTMKRMGAMMAPIPIDIKMIKNNYDLGASLMKDNKAFIEIGTLFAFEDELTDTKKELVLYGVFAHEMLHIFLTDFDYLSKQLKKYPSSEVYFRHFFYNILEDAAIEYQRHPDISDFLNKALSYSIGWAYRNSPEIKGNSAFEELAAALIQFGDVGFLKGNFSFPEAKDCFKKIAPLMLEGIKEVDFKKRFGISQEMFEIAKPLLIDYMKDNLSAASEIKKLAEKHGKQISESSGAALSPNSEEQTGQNESQNKNSESQKRREAIVSRIKNETGKDSEQKGTDASQSGSASKKEDNKSSHNGDPSAQKKNNDCKEEENISKSESASEESVTKNDIANGKNKTDRKNGSESEDTENESQNHDSSVQEEKNDCKEEEAENSKSGSASNDSENESDAENNENGMNSEKNSESENGENKSQENDSQVKEEEKNAYEEEETDMSQSESVSDNSEKESSIKNSESKIDPKNNFKDEDVNNKHKKEKEDISQSGSNIKESEFEGNNPSNEEFEASEDLLKKVDEISENSEKQMIEEEKRLAKKMSVEDINPEVSCAYYKKYPYNTVKITQDNDCDYDYNRLNDIEIRRHKISLISSLKKIFADPGMLKAYKTNGRLNLDRYSKQKPTARLFYKRNRPDDKADLAIVILVDQSGSMIYNINSIKKSLILLLDTFREFEEIKVKLIGFTSFSEVTYYHYGDDGWKNNKNLVKSAMKVNANGGTFLGHAIRYSAALLKKRPEKHKMFICITDGYPEYYNIYGNLSQGINDCRTAVNEIKKYSDVIGVGVYNSEENKKMFEMIFGESCVSMSSLDALTRELPKKIKKIMK